MTSSRTLQLSAVLSVCLFATAVFAQKVGPTVRITAPINTSQLVTLKGTVHPFANSQNDRGLAPQGMQLNRMHLILKRSPAQQTALLQLIQEQNTPGSPNYHKWLTPAQFAAQFGPSKQDITTVENWLSSQGFTVNKLEPGNQVLDISGNVAQLGSAFHTQIHKYMVNGQLHYANANNPSIPAALAPVVGGFVSLNNFRYKSYAQRLGEATYDPSTGKAKPSWTVGGGSFDYQNYNFILSPDDYAVQYNIKPLYSAGINGSGQTIAIVNESNININLVNRFRTLFGLPPNPPQIIIDGNDPGIDGINNPDGPNYASTEAYLDVEWAGAVAPGATIDLVIAADTSLESGLALAAEHAVYSDVAPVVSISFGLCELFNGSGNTFWNNLWQQAAAQGQTVVVSTGDNGSAGCDSPSSQFAQNGLAVNGLASTPYNVAVGGTDFYYSNYSQGASAIDTQLGTYWGTTASNSTPTASIKKYIPEQPWNDSQYGLNLFDYYNETGNTTVAGGSGGASSAAICPNNSYDSSGLCSGTPSGYPKPAWQTGSGVPADGVRDLPDVSLFAADGLNDSYYPICATDGDCQPASSGGTVQLFGVGGTSASAPAFAGIMALVNQKYGRQGQANTILYPLKAQYPAAFHDVTNGTNSVPCYYSSTSTSNSPKCIAVSNPLTIQITSSSGITTNVTEGQLGTSSTTPAYNAAAGYNLATGLGSVDAYQLVTNWGNVKLGSTSVSLTPTTGTTFTHGTAFSFNGAVTGSSGTPTGDVALMTDTTEMSQQGLTNFTLDGSGNYSGSLTTLPGGSYNIWASYGGDNNNAAAISTKIPITVNPEPSGIAFGLFANGSNTYYTAASNPGTSVDYGTQLMLSARVAPTANNDVATLQACTPSGSTTTCPSGYSAPTGTVTFSDSSSGSGLPTTAAINSEGDAEFNAPFSVGSHSVSASYSGDKSYNPSSASAPITFTVVKDTPQIFGSASLIDSSGNLYNGTGQQTALTIMLENNAVTAAQTSSASFPVPVAPPTGTITLSGSSVSALNGTFNLSAGVDPNSGAPAGIATVYIPATTASGNYQVAVAYSGDSNYNSIAASSNTTFSIPLTNLNSNGGLTSTTAATVSGSISPDSTLVVQGTVTGQSNNPAPTGDVYLYSSGYNLTYAKLNPPASGVTSTFQITLNSQTLLQGSNQIAIQYWGDKNYNPSAYVLNTAVSNPLSDFTMVPETSIVPVTAGDNAGGNVTVNLAAVNGFSGAVNLSCTATAGVNCSVSPSSASISSGTSATATLTITAPAAAADGTYNVALVGKDSTGEYVHTAGVKATVSGSTAGTDSFALSANPDHLAFVPAATTGNTTTINVTPTGSGNFSGIVDLSCSVSPSSSTSPTCSIPSSVTLSGSFVAQPATLTMTSDNSTTPGAYVVTVTGTSGGLTMTTTVKVSVGDFTMDKSGDITVTAGATTGNTSTITIAPQGSFSAAVDLKCAVTTSITNPNAPPTCSIPSSVTLTGSGSQTATLTVTTTAPTTSMNQHKSPLWPATGGGAMFAALLFFWIPKKRRSWLAMVVLLVFFVSMAGMACGGGGGSSSGGGGGTTTTPGTTAGSYTVTVTGTSGSLSHTTTVSLTVK